MHYVYILRSSKDKQMYVGCTNDLQKRLGLHNKGLVPATQRRTPFDLIFYEAFLSKEDAYAREKWLKTGWGKGHIQKMLKHHLKSLGG